MNYASVWLECEELGCSNGINPVEAPLTNLTAPGGWACHEHDVQEVPC